MGVLLAAGYWPGTYWPVGYWQPAYWGPEYVEASGGPGLRRAALPWAAFMAPRPPSVREEIMRQEARRVTRDVAELTKISDEYEASIRQAMARARWQLDEETEEAIERLDAYRQDLREALSNARAMGSRQQLARIRKRKAKK